MHFPNMNDMVNVSDLLELNKALRKSADIGYQTPANTAGAGSLSPLVPQSIEGTLASATYTMNELTLWPNMPKRSVSQTVHEYTVVDDHGLDLDPFIAEGGAGTNNASRYRRESVRIKYLAERREVTDVATMVGLIGPNANAIAEETQRGTIRLMQKVERTLFHGDEALNSNGYDGIIKQIAAGGNVTDLGGSALSPDLIQETLGDLQSAPFFGRPDCIYVEPTVYQDLIRQTVAFGRHDQMKVSSGSSLTFGAQNLNMMSTYGPIPVKAAPFLFTAFSAPAAGSGGASAPAQPTFVGGAGATWADNGSAGQFTAADAGDYIYKLVAVSDGGYSDPLDSVVTAITPGDTMECTINDVAAKAGPVPVKYYRVYRSEKDDTTGASCKLLFEAPANADGAGGETVLIDSNAVKPKTSKALIVQHDPQIMEFVRLLDFLRRPLAEVATTKPFLLMLFGAPIVKVPTKCWLLDNVGTN